MEFFREIMVTETKIKYFRTITKRIIIIKIILIKNKGIEENEIKLVFDCGENLQTKIRLFG